MKLVYSTNTQQDAFLKEKWNTTTETRKYYTPPSNIHYKMASFWMKVTLVSSYLSTYSALHYKFKQNDSKEAFSLDGHRLMIFWLKFLYSDGLVTLLLTNFIIPAATEFNEISQVGDNLFLLKF
jgi:hypothetical protein